jgi:hypothetical protein
LAAKVLKNALANGVFLDLQNVTFAKPAAAWPRGIPMMEGVGKNSLLVIFLFGISCTMITSCLVILFLGLYSHAPEKVSVGDYGICDCLSSNMLGETIIRIFTNPCWKGSTCFFLVGGLKDASHMLHRCFKDLSRCLITYIVGVLSPLWHKFQRHLLNLVSLPLCSIRLNQKKLQDLSGQLCDDGTQKQRNFTGVKNNIVKQKDKHASLGLFLLFAFRYVILITNQTS